MTVAAASCLVSLAFASPSCRLSLSYALPSLSSFFNHPTRSTIRARFSSFNGGESKHRPSLVRPMASSSSPSDSPLEAEVKNTVSEHSVVVYSKTWCSYSSEVKALFNGLRVEPMVIELDEMGSQGSQVQKVLERLTGQHTVPNVFIGGKHIGGFTDTLKLYEEGELEVLLSEASAKKP